MIAPVPPVPPVPPSPPSPSPASTSAVGTGAGSATTTTPSGFTAQLGSAVDGLQSSEAAANRASLGVAAGAESLPDYMIEATQAEMNAELTVAVRNAAITSLNQVLDM